MDMAEAIFMSPGLVGEEGLVFAGKCTEALSAGGLEAVTGWNDRLSSTK